MPQSSTPSRPLMLLLEDESSMVAVIRDLLEPDFEIDVAGTVEEARLLLASRQYALILSDHMMPGEPQGLDFLIEALERQPSAKRILMTGYINPELHTRSIPLAQLSACLLKPLDLAKLRATVKAAIATPVGA